MVDKPDSVEIFCQRVLGMVLELHKRGYQNMAIFSCMSPSGLHWRCDVMPYEWITYQRGGYFCPQHDDTVKVACYTSGASDRYFGWEDAGEDTPGLLADKFEARFPDLCELCRGANYAFSGWLTYAIGMADGEHLPVMYSDYDDFEPGWIGSTSGVMLKAPPYGVTKGE